MTVYYSDLKDAFWIRDGDQVRWYDTEREARAAEKHYSQPRGYAGDFETHPVGTAQRIKALEAEIARLRSDLRAIAAIPRSEAAYGLMLVLARAALKGDE